jgi:hypothetical protein
MPSSAQVGEETPVYGSCECRVKRMGARVCSGS